MVVEVENLVSVHRQGLGKFDIPKAALAILNLAYFQIMLSLYSRLRSSRP